MDHVCFQCCHLTVDKSWSRTSSAQYSRDRLVLHHSWVLGSTLTPFFDVAILTDGDVDDG
jgi:hypothetical protein